MNLDYKNIEKFKGLSSVKLEYAQWFNSICATLAYIDQFQIVKGTKLPTLFPQWLENNIEGDGEKELIRPVLELFEDVSQKYSAISSKIENGKRPDLALFNQFKNDFYGFLASLQRLAGLEFSNDGDGHKAQILKSAIEIKEDLNREMERMARINSPFALSMVRIDGFEKMEINGRPLADAIKVVSKNILKTVRPFDDAYFIEHGYFLISFKHTDVVGADAAMARLQQSLMLDKENQKESLTISCCMAEPVAGDELNGLLGVMRADLENHKDDKEAILRFLDVSPLQKYMNIQN